MRFCAAYLIGLAVLLGGSAAFAADEFGERFTNENPAALQEEPQSIEQQLQQIAPAAGDKNGAEAAPVAAGRAAQRGSAVMPPQQDNIENPEATTDGVE